MSSTSAPQFPEPQLHPNQPSSMPLPSPSLPISGGPSVSVNIPDNVVDWFAYLNRHEKRNKHGISFMEYGPILKEQGFVEVAQLTLEWTTPSLLKDLLSIPIGTAILIKQLVMLSALHNHYSIHLIQTFEQPENHITTTTMLLIKHLISTIFVPAIGILWHDYKEGTE